MQAQSLAVKDMQDADIDAGWRGDGLKVGRQIDIVPRTGGLFEAACSSNSRKLGWVMVMKLSHFASEAIALDALTFIVSSEEIAGRFIDVTGIDLSRIRDEATKPDFLRGVMQFIIESDELIVACATAVGVKPEEVVAAGQALGVAWD